MQGISLEAQMGAGAHPPRAWGQGKNLGVHSQKKGGLPEGSKQGRDVI